MDNFLQSTDENDAFAVELGYLSGSAPDWIAFYQSTKSGSEI